MEAMRIGSIVRLKPECREAYAALHANVWPALLELFREYHVRNFTIFERDGFLFSYKEYTGTDYAGDMAELCRHPLMREWFRLTDPCQERWPTAEPGALWADGTIWFHMP